MSETALNHTKIIATIGPASASPEMLHALVKAGMNVCRLNFSHVDYAKATEIIEEIKKINAKNLFPVALLADLQGPKLRVGEMGCNGAELKNDALVVITC
ncbi:MAG TPA: pyruvate kinase, partial [Bacteroidales bacterium]|nr:pyruvate kinase [Bacteroidales bacterium]